MSEGKRFPPGWTARGVVELPEPLAGDDRTKTIAERVAARIGSVTLLMDSPQDPLNAAAAAPVRRVRHSGLHVVPREDEFALGRKVTRGTGAGRRDHVRERRSRHASAGGSRLRLVATHPDGALVPEDLKRSRAFAW